MNSESGSGEKSGGGFLAFWTTLPGILTGVAAVLTAIVGLIALFHSNNSGGNIPVTQAQERSRPATSQATITDAASTAAGVLAHGRISMSRDDSADLEQGVIVNSPTGDVTFGPESTPNLSAANEAFLAPAQPPATKRSCTAALSARHDAFEVLPQLDTTSICVSTTEGHVAVVHVVRLPGVGNAQLVLDYTVWA